MGMGFEWLGSIWIGLICVDCVKVTHILIIKLNDSIPPEKIQKARPRGDRDLVLAYIRNDRRRARKNLRNISRLLGRGHLLGFPNFLYFPFNSFNFLIRAHDVPVHNFDLFLQLIKHHLRVIKLSLLVQNFKFNFLILPLLSSYFLRIVNFI